MGEVFHLTKITVLYSNLKQKIDKYVGNPTCGDVFGVVGPSLVANAKWFYAFDLALGVPAAVDLRACVLAGLLGRSAYQGRGAGARKASGQVGADG